MTTGSRPDTDLDLADVLSEQLMSETEDQLLAEVAKDFGDRHALAKEFDGAFGRALARDRKRRIADFFYGMAGWKPIAITAALILVASLSALYLADRTRKDVLSRIAENETHSRTPSTRSEQRSDAELDAVQARFDLLRAAGDTAAAKAAAEQYLLVAKARYGEEHPIYAKGLNEIAVLYVDSGNYRAAEATYLRSIAITEKELGPEQSGLIMPLTGLASLYEAQIRLREAQSTDWQSTTGATRGLSGGTSPRAKLAEVQARLAKVRDATGTQSTVTQTAQGGELLKVLRMHTDGVESCAFSPDGRRLVTASPGKLRLWDVATDRVIDEFAGHGAGVLSLVLETDGQIVATYVDGTILTWTRDRQRMIETMPRWPGRTLALTSGGRQLVATATNTVRLIDRDREIGVFEGHTGPVTNAAFGPNDIRILTVSDDRTIRVWDAATARPLSVLRTQSVQSRAAFSRDGRQVVSVGKDDTNVNLWDAVTGKQTATLSGHLRPVLHAAFSADGKQLVTTSNDGTARLWDARSGRARAILKGHEAAVTSAAFGPDGALVATTSEDRTVRIWRAFGGDVVHVQGDEAIYGSDDRITFRRNVELYYAGRFILTADEVVYDARDQTLTASGSVVVRNSDGSRTVADTYQLPAEIRDAFVRSLNTTVPDGAGSKILNFPGQKQ